MRQQLAQFDVNLQELRPDENLSGLEEFGSEQKMVIENGMGILQDLTQLDELSDTIVR